eukprot:NODE_5750_length_616_cov_6.214724_g5586_i0.p1 GENE.NODE_5750_length_616_cov_6.214724_g5586_i0~~NODE_5750_length_616_cov_6.214724_g5586_i0.p1  ORF type:complete len:176 (-),score=65.67 NODE_5750_length_616_cov_6.214724_g5586_i0:75-602(-)
MDHSSEPHGESAEVAALKAAVLARLSEQQLAEFREAFYLFDTDGSYEIDAKELGAALRSVGQDYTEQEIHDLIAEIDLDHSGSINLHEFLFFAAHQTCDFIVEEQLRGVFNEFDINADGLISIDELQAAIAHHTGETLCVDEMQGILFESGHDTDGDGCISFEEFVHYMCVEGQR